MNEGTTRKKLVRDIKREALARMEAAARTEEEFQQVSAQWDHRDENRERRERRERDHEILREHKKLQWNVSPGSITFPSRSGRVFHRQMMAGEFVDIMHSCPYEMHELVQDRDASKVLRDISENHREILWFHAVRFYDTERLARMRDCSERNIRKTRELMLKRLREKLLPAFQKRIAAGDATITWNIRTFLSRYKGLQKVILDDKHGK